MKLRFWVAEYLLDLGGRARIPPSEYYSSVAGLFDFLNELPGGWEFRPGLQHEHRLYYGYGVLLEVRADRSLIVEFKAPEAGKRFRSADTVDQWFLSSRYIARHSHLLEPLRKILRGSRPDGT